MLSLRDFGIVLIVVIIWGTNFVAIRWGLDELPPFLFTAVRFFMVAVPAIFLIKPPKLEWWKTFLVGLFICLGQFSLLFMAINLGLKAGLASLLMQSQVLITIILSYFVFNERVNLAQAFGIIVAFSGFAIFYALRAEGGLPILPLFLALIAAFSWACGNLVYKVAGNANRFHITIYSGLVPVIPMLFASYYFENKEIVHTIANITVKGWLTLGYNAYLSTIVAYSLWAVLMGRYHASVVTPFALLIPVFGLLSTAFFLGETLTAMEIVASCLIAIGIFISMMSQRILRIFAK